MDLSVLENIGLDKDEIIRISREIGTYETSCGPEHCDALGPVHPSTEARESAILEEEEKLDIDSILEEYSKKVILWKQF